MVIDVMCGVVVDVGFTFAAGSVRSFRDLGFPFVLALAIAAPDLRHGLIRSLSEIRRRCDDAIEEFVRHSREEVENMLVIDLIEFNDGHNCRFFRVWTRSGVFLRLLGISGRIFG